MDKLAERSTQPLTRCWQTGREDSAEDNETCSRPPTDLRGSPCGMRRPLWAKRHRGAMQPKPSAVWNTPRAGDAWQIRRTYMAIRDAAPPGPFCLATGQISPARAASSLCGLKWNTALVASGHRGQRWGKVEGRRFSAPPFSVSPQDNGKLKNISTHHFI